MKKRIISFIIIFIIIISSVSVNVYAGINGGNTHIADVVDGDDGLQYLTFEVSSTSSTAKFKYKTIGWDITFIPDGEEPKKTSRITYNFSDHGGSDTVKLDLEKEVFFDKISDSEEEKKDRLKTKKRW